MYTCTIIVIISTQCIYVFSLYLYIVACFSYNFSYSLYPLKCFKVYNMPSHFYAKKFALLITFNSKQIVFIYWLFESLWSGVWKWQDYKEDFVLIFLALDNILETEERERKQREWWLVRGSETEEGMEMGNDGRTDLMIDKGRWWGSRGSGGMTEVLI